MLSFSVLEFKTFYTVELNYRLIFELKAADLLGLRSVGVALGAPGVPGLGKVAGEWIYHSLIFICFLFYINLFNCMSWKLKNDFVDKYCVMPLKNVFFKFPALIVCMTNINNTKSDDCSPRAHEKKKHL